jgi:lipopolysaccharide transport protein LptA
MEANDIDLTYAADGRALQSADLRERASLRLPVAGGAAGRTITGRRIQDGMSPDGATVTSLNAMQNVQLELPADGQTPARRIRAATLTAAGAPESGLQSAAFDGGVTFDEWRAAAKGPQSAPTRTARSRKLIVETQPGLGAVQRADFRGNVRFVDGKTTAEAPRAIYNVTEDGIDLSPAEGEPGPEPNVDDGQVSVKARTIALGLTSKKLEAETDVRSSLEPTRQTDATKLPSMLKKDEPVSVTANRLSYDGAATLAKYSGNVNLWQGQTSIKANAVDVDDKTGNLAARGNVRTVMFFEDEDPKTKKRSLAQTIASGDTFLYEEAKRLATYTTGASAKAHINGPQGDVVGDRIQLFLRPKVNELERAIADGNVVVKESNRTAKGAHLTHTAADQKYVMTGTPVEVDEITPPDCKRTLGTTLTFFRATQDVIVEGILGVQQMEIKPYKCTGEPRD